MTWVIVCAAVVGVFGLGIATGKLIARLQKPSIPTLAERLARQHVRDLDRRKSEGPVSVRR